MKKMENIPFLSMWKGSVGSKDMNNSYGMHWCGVTASFPEREINQFPFNPMVCE